ARWRRLFAARAIATAGDLACTVAVAIAERRNRHRGQRGTVEADLVGLSRAIAVALLRPNVNDDRTLELQRPLEGREQGAQVVAGNQADVGDPEVLEQATGLDEVDDRRPQPLAELADGRTDAGNPADQLVV